MIFYVFVDGIGIGSYQPETNPFSRFAKGLLSPLGGLPLSESRLSAKASQIRILETDAHMGIPGLPQSATGQTALWTGVNGPQVLGRHVSGFPTVTLRKIIAQHSIIKVMQEAGKQADFLNCFTDPYLKHVRENPKLVSASTLVQTASDRPLKNLEDLRNGRGLYMDITRGFLREMAKDFLSPDDPVLEPQDPYNTGKAVFSNFKDYDLCIYEYFLTDKVGHAQDWEKAQIVIEILESFLEGCIDGMDIEKDTFILTSDHGNLEDLSQKNHTENKVPTYLSGKLAAEMATSIQSLKDIPLQIYKSLGMWDAINSLSKNEFEASKL
ncbi:metalloenzyme domain protein [Leptospira ryugenii]|uniref:Metalloenzyme domain protein n=1 Tax=Leptospira ryugenii TaxID=1917863 RepID=A0A2P2DYR7_9LEPT|nr:metalloenzyme [Leptospira ryugenii]GBF49771.1 metalloenzyme domain protein [Leptospira ryugenii]